LTIGRKRKKLIRAMIHNLIIKEKEVNLNSLIGYLSFLHDIEPEYLESSIIPYQEKLAQKKQSSS